MGPAIAEADLAVENGKIDGLARMLSERLREQLEARFRRVSAARRYKAGEVSAGREFVAAYVDFVHFAERVNQALGAGGENAGHQH